MRILVYEGPKQLRVVERGDLEAGPGQVRIRTLYSGISHGSEMNVYRGIAPFFSRNNDSEYRLFRPVETEEAWHYPIRSCDPGVWYMGYACVGEVVETGEDAGDLKPGDLVYANAPHQSEAVKSHREVIKLPQDLPPEFGVLFTNLMTAYNGILDTRIKLGDTVVVSGLGVLGQLVVQMAKMSGAHRVIGVDVLDKRLQTALAVGADHVFNAASGEDVAYEIRKLTNARGADAVIEVSGSQRALQQAIRMAAPDCTVTALGWYQGACVDLNLAEEFHHNRITLKSSQTSRINPDIRHMWDHKRKEETCLSLLARLKLDNLITHRIPYEQAADAYRMIDSHADDIIQVVLTY
ncbi:zinc-dependent alcohol dehydrogenase [Cohnella fermenti]|uniref:Zinc-binding alcohol dehydrogenase n=1 Tax=Cohnella fermenti TaxID=2565925 RepID=A0A4S4BYK3_9BACL|nr:zinc-binding alcohol dehydrogenase [Cohnella fermenti]THF80346.1 zinc-binding alcohol dehydrogenase [Cohnella fermenti]